MTLEETTLTVPPLISYVVLHHWQNSSALNEHGIRHSCDREKRVGDITGTDKASSSCK